MWNNVRKVRGSSLQRSSEHREKGTQLDVHLAAKVIARPHYEERTDRSSRAEDSIGSGNCICCDRVISRLAFPRKIEVRVPSRLTDSTADDRGAVAVRLSI